MEERKLQNYLTLFGLDESFTSEDLARSYRSLAFLNHPDHAGEESHLRMVIVNEAHQFLNEYRQNNTPGESKCDPVFSLYKRAVGALNDAFDRYYGHSIDTSALKTELAGVKELFARIVKDYDTSDYFLDSVDRICSINRWFD